MSKVADRQKMPFVIDVTTADQITQQGFQVYLPHFSDHFAAP